MDFVRLPHKIIADGEREGLAGRAAYIKENEAKLAANRY